MPKSKNKFGDVLLQEHVITAQQLTQALALQKEQGGKLGEILLKLKIINERTLLIFLSKHLKLEYIDLNNFNIDPEIAHKIPEKIARRFKMIALQQKTDQYTVGMADPTDVLAIDEMNKILNNITTHIVLVSESSLINVIDKLYRRTEDIESFAKELQAELGKDKETLAHHVDQNGSEDDTSPVSRLLDSIFEDALQIGASDIHIEPENNLVRIRQRVDGLLQEHIIEEKQVAESLALRIKLLAQLNISEKRLPQDGRFILKIKDRSLDVRVATMPVRSGESIVLRLLDQANGLLAINQLGMSAELLQKVFFHIKRPNGLILVTGPTGSGKTTTLYAILNELNLKEKKIITIEDPVEYSLPRITQVQVNSTIGLTFAKILRTVLRQDPEIIMIGEMRDEETVQICLRAAMTGHLVIATLHTNDAITSATRLLDMGAQSYLLAASLRFIIAQRLVRKNCSNCGKEYEITAEEKEILQNLIGEIHSAWKFYKGSGCANCNNTGYKGRIAVHETLAINAELSNALRSNNPAVFTATALQQQDFKPLALNILQYALDGITSLEEIFRMANQVG